MAQLQRKKILKGAPPEYYRINPRPRVDLTQPEGIIFYRYDDESFIEWNHQTIVAEAKIKEDQASVLQKEADAVALPDEDSDM